MELWIKSQDKEKLVKCNDIAIATDTEDGKTIRCYKIVGYFDKQTEYEELGFYTLHSRALEVLDEIQNILFLKDMYKYDKELVLKSWENVDEEQVKIVRQQISVYEMPED